MLAILKKEFHSFFASPVGYLVIGLFLILNGLFLWVFDNDFNLFDYGFADLTPFFHAVQLSTLFFIWGERWRTGCIWNMTMQVWLLVIESRCGWQDKKPNRWNYYHGSTHLWWYWAPCRHFFDRALAFLYRHDYWFCYRWGWLFVVAYESKKKKVTSL